ncbi:MAG: hypothetical protein QOD13_2365 [Thermoleophilaceae bacterium]|jgi:hypothetical protein|nr:hypothetical protein [Thermoleophilaceae bacterium]
MPIVEEYWAGVLARLQAEVDVFARLVRHKGEQGRENEAALARLLGSFVPRRFGIGTGLVIDASDRTSRQMDLVVFEQSDEPAVLAQTTQLLYPVEAVVACIEVKTTIRKDELEDCARKKASISELEPRRTHPDGSRHPLFFVLGYSAALLPASIYRALQDIDPSERPDVISVLEPGVLAGRTEALQQLAADDYAGGLVLLRDKTGTPINGTPRGSDMMAEHEGRLYPLVKYRDEYVLVDPARNLLLFAEALVRLLADQQGRREPVLTHYLDVHTRHLAPFIAR